MLSIVMHGVIFRRWSPRKQAYSQEGRRRSEEEEDVWNYAITYVQRTIHTMMVASDSHSSPNKRSQCKPLMALVESECPGSVDSLLAAMSVPCLAELIRGHCLFSASIQTNHHHSGANFGRGFGSQMHCSSVRAALG